MEELYQYVWRYRLLPAGKTFLADGRPFEIIDPGILNRDSGPDFFNGKIRIEGCEWAGNIEIHVKASDWLRHGHEGDASYDNVILHVVGVDDKRILRHNGQEIPQYVLSLSPATYETYASLSGNSPGIRCLPYIKDIPRIAMEDWLESLSVERLQQKAENMRQVLDATGGDWEQACFVAFARALGFGLNSEPFEQLGRSIPLKVLHHHSDDRHQLEALLFGQAGLLDSSIHIFDEYYQSLCREYWFLLRKYGLKPLPSYLWKFARTRPQNFPHRRIALLAAACSGGFSLLRELVECDRDIDKLHNILDWEVSDYWKKHFTFGTDEKIAPASLSSSSKNLLLINAVSPMLYLYGCMRNYPDSEEKALWILEALPGEKNHIVSAWRTCGMEVKDALRSQALIQLRKKYCDEGKCMYCRIGHKMLRMRIDPEEKSV